ncbi:MAG TPA: hypothetical protein VD837_10920 [Terriglobales bacterium]|nr:hypothetical protein [Terriglobales bacterium]
MARALEAYRPLAYIQEPGTLDGGDVLRLGQHIYVGLSGRSNWSAVTQFREIVSKFAYVVHEVPVSGCLHLKSAVTQVSADTLLINPAWISRDAFSGWRLLEIASGEDYAANALLVGEKVIYPTSFPATRGRLEENGIPVVALDISELQKAEGAVTCCSLIFHHEV